MAFSESIHVKMPHQVSTIYQHINYGIVTSVFIFYCCCSFKGSCDFVLLLFYCCWLNGGFIIPFLNICWHIIGIP